MNRWMLFILFVVSSYYSGQAQVGYQKDSLQIKVYSIITYEKSHPQKIEIGKVFCDYCNDNQLTMLKGQAWELTYAARYAPENRIDDGKRKLALFIRVSKEDFKKLKDQEK
ncbi:MAG: hypothetical protein ABJM06_06740 [Gilvibacter sp.]